MRVLNCLFARGLGGIEQSYVDYGTALLSKGHQVLQLCHPQAAIISKLEARNLSWKGFSNFGQWDFLARCRLKKFLREWEPDFLIAHGNRAISLLCPATKGLKKPAYVIGVAHNHRIRRFPNLDAAFTVSNMLRDEAIELGLPASRVFHMPNMIVLPENAPSPRSLPQTPHIGTIGRFVPKKGFDDFLRALAILVKQGLNFRATIGGDGEERDLLRNLRDELGLKEHVAMPGWIENSTAFYRELDIFCLPSQQEPFGIVVLEAMAAGLPIVSTATEGPSEMLTDNVDGLLVTPGDPSAIAAGFVRILQTPDLATQLGSKAWETVQTRFALPRVAERMDAALKSLKQEFVA